MSTSATINQLPNKKKFNKSRGQKENTREHHETMQMTKEQKRKRKSEQQRDQSTISNTDPERPAPSVIS